MLSSDVCFTPSTRTLRQFAALWIGFFLALAFWQGFYQGREGLAVALALLALTVGTLGLVWPLWVRKVYVAWMFLAFPIGWGVSHAVLAWLFYGLFTPVGLVFRLLGRDALLLRRPADRETYWMPRPPVCEPGRYFRQF
jgi:hypothetical protein